MLWKYKIQYEGESEYREEIHYSEKELQLNSSNIKSAIVERFTYNIKHIYEPFILTFGEEKFIFPNNIKAHPQTTKDDIVWEKWESKEHNIAQQEWKFESSSYKGDFYKVKKHGNKITCSCPGSWRAKDRTCKHIKQVQQMLASKAI